MPIHDDELPSMQRMTEYTMKRLVRGNGVEFPTLSGVVDRFRVGAYDADLSLSQ